MSSVADLLKAILASNGDINDSNAEFLAAVAASNSHPPLNGGMALLKNALGGGSGTINDVEIGRRE